ncbi:MAG: endonuclease/exonuclease/phosphatase family protein [Verrucomicrobiae bacterium]|nr:endonuclease/exonuclease/phosphatase family protein [Verrucomicrobiae bacterium]
MGYQYLVGILEPPSVRGPAVASARIVPAQRPASLHQPGHRRGRDEIMPRHRFTLLTTHLKSRRQTAIADEAELRAAEARILREKVDAILNASPNANVVVCGDFNDTRDSEAIRTLVGRGKSALTDTRPYERNGDTKKGDGYRTVTWTHFYGKEDTYSRIDYILLSKGMSREWKADGSYVFSGPDWGLASDHRPVVCEFFATNR